MNREMKAGFFDPIRIGKSLKEIQVDFIKTESENVTSRWFHGAQETDLFIWSDSKNNLIKHQVTFCGQVVEWNIVDGLKTGYVVEEEFENQQKASELIKYDKQVNKTAIHQALELLENMEQIKEAEKLTMMDNFKLGHKLSTMTDSEFVKKFSNYKKDDKPSFFQKILKIFKR